MRAAAFVVLLGLLAGCGGSSGGPPTVKVALDFTPNPVHAPIYVAAQHPSHGVRLQIRKPGSGPDSLKLVAGGKVDLGVLDIQDLAIAADQGVGVVAVGELIDRPLGALIAQPAITRPRDLEGRTVGVSGLPSDPAFVDAIVRHDGGDPRKIKEVTIGFAAVDRLLTRRVDAVPAFWNAEGVALRRRGRHVREFHIDDYGAPRYPEVVLIASRRTLAEHRARIAAALDAIADGQRATLAHPQAAVRLVAHAAQTSDTALLRAQLDAVRSSFAPGLRMNRALLERWAAFDARLGVVKTPPDVAHTFDFSLRG